jgi:hypothetical protein
VFRVQKIKIYEKQLNKICNNIVYWTAEDFATRGEPICAICDIDMKVVIEE